MTEHYDLNPMSYYCALIDVADIPPTEIMHRFAKDDELNDILRALYGAENGEEAFAAMARMTALEGKRGKLIFKPGLTRSPKHRRI